METQPNTTLPPSNEQSVKRKRGRPKGSKNKPKATGVSPSKTSSKTAKGKKKNVKVAKKPTARKVQPGKPTQKKKIAETEVKVSTAPASPLAASGEEETPKKKGRPTNVERAARQAAKSLAEALARGEEIIIPPTPTTVYRPGQRVETAPSSAVANIIFKGTVSYQSPASSFVRVLWDDMSNQYHHVDSIVPSNSKKGKRTRKTFKGDTASAEEPELTEEVLLSMYYNRADAGLPYLYTSGS